MKLQLYKILIPCILVVFLIGLFGTNPTGAATRKKEIVFDGKILKMSPPGVLSGGVPSYRLVKYEVISVLAGTLEPKEIVVDHLILTGEEFSSLGVGDNVIVVVIESKSIGARFNFEGIRESSDQIKNYYLAETLRRICPVLRPE